MQSEKTGYGSFKIQGKQYLFVNIVCAKCVFVNSLTNCDSICEWLFSRYVGGLSL